MVPERQSASCCSMATRGMFVVVLVGKNGERRRVVETNQSKIAKARAEADWATLLGESAYGEEFAIVALTTRWQRRYNQSRVTHRIVVQLKHGLQSVRPQQRDLMGSRGSTRNRIMRTFRFRLCTPRYPL